MGVSSSATANDASMATAKVSTSGRLNAVTSVPITRKGRVASRIARVAKTSGPRVAENAASIASLRRSGWPASAASGRRAALMSVTTSSITRTMAAASPASVIAVNVVPSRYRT